MPTPVEKRRRETAAKVSALTIANAFIFQEQLAAANSQVQPVRSLLSEKDFVLATMQHWTFICDTINYVPIFRIAGDILSALPAIASSDDAVRRLARQAILLTQNKAAFRHDLSPFTPLPEMASDLNRRLVDQAISKALDVPDCSALRMLLAQEPIVSNRRLAPAGTPAAIEQTDQLELL
jgi:hypothetical protein